MFKKMNLKRRINKKKKRIEELEQKRIRSQAALVEAILTNDTPDDGDVEYFNRYTKLINDERDQMHALIKELEAL